LSPLEQKLALVPHKEVIGVAALAHPDLVIEIVAVGALPD
jgi:hypothetical protein